MQHLHLCTPLLLSKGQIPTTLIQEKRKRGILQVSKMLSGAFIQPIIHYKKDLDLDADNLSKPIWDGLVNFLYSDDSQIKLRIAGSFDISKTDFNILDMSGLSGNILTELFDAFDTEDHILYIECGDFHHSMIKFNILNNGN